MLGQERLCLRAAQPGLEGGGHRDRVDREQPLHPDQVEAEHTGVPLAAGDETAGDRRTAAERDHGDPVATRHLEHRLHLVGVGRTDDGVGRVGEVARPSAQEVGRGLAAGAQPPGLVVGVHVVGADDGRQVAQRRVGDPDRWQRHRGVGVHPVVGDREHQLHQTAGGLRQVGGAVWVAPAGRVHLSSHVLQCDT